MQKVFWDNPYQCDLTTEVSAVDGAWVCFAETIAYSFSGGQESDLAYVNGMQVIESCIEAKLIYYSLPEMHGLHVGDQVQMNIDWRRRYKLMRLHFAAELILELITQRLGFEKVGAHIAEDKARIDFCCDRNISPFLDSILTDYQQIIVQDAIIKTGFSDIENQRRYWEIEGIAKVACGGTHVRSTAEVGFVRLKRVNVGKGKERIEIRLVDA